MSAHRGQGNRGRGGYGQGGGNRGSGNRGHGGNGDGARSGSSGQRQVASIELPSHVSLDLTPLPPKYDEKKIVGESLFVTKPGYGQEYVMYNTLIANHFPINSTRKKNVAYHYDVAIEVLDDSSPTEGMSKMSIGGQAKAHTRKVSKDQNKKVFERMVLENKGPDQMFHKILPVFDFRANMYTASPIKQLGTTPGDKVSLDVIIAEEKIQWDKTGFPTQERVGGHYRVTIAVDSTSSSAIDLNVTDDPDILQAIQVRNVILNYGPALTKILVGDNSLFPMNACPVDLGGGVGMIHGHSQSTRPSAAGMTVIVNTKVGAFYLNKSVLDFMIAFSGGREQPFDFLVRNQWRREQIKQVLKGVRMVTFHTGNKFPRKNFSGFSTDPLSECYIDKGKTKSVIAYFKETYPRVQLKHTNLPCLVFSFKNPDGSPKPTLIPIELCFLEENQRVLGRLSGAQTRIMIKETAIPPADRLNAIYHRVKAVNEEAKSYLDEFGYELSMSPLRVPGKVYGPPTLLFGNGLKKKPSVGVGSWKLDDAKLFKGITLKKWLVVSMCPGWDGDSFVNGLVAKGTAMGLSFDRSAGSWRVIERQDTSKASIESCFQLAQNNKIQLIVFVVTESDLAGTVRTNVKFLGDTKFGILTQCINVKNVSKPPEENGQVISNIILKINAKLGGINSVIAPTDVPLFLAKPGVMIIGADVTHQASDALTQGSVYSGNGNPAHYSVAAVVGTIDNKFFEYATAVRLQKRDRQEIITQIGDMILEILKSYFDRNQKTLPEHIVYYRDGVSEGQFQAVLLQEVRNILSKCEDKLTRFNIKNSKATPYKPKITVIIVQKRHHTRVRPQFPNAKGESQGKMGNVPAGTTCDTTITHPRNFDFFMVSHEGIQGTSKPSHYCVIRDDARIGVDALYKATFYLTHMYAKCTRSISVPAPVMYAHLAAFRARDYLVAAEIAPVVVHRDASEAEVEDAIDEHVTELNGKIQVLQALRCQLYFC